MNILPHKSWHVRTKANIARVRKDEAKAAEEEKERQRRIELAESEARTSHLREKAKQKFGNIKLSPEHQSSVKEEKESVAHEHVNLFRDVEEGTDGFKKTNEDREKEEKETQEKYEKSIGYLTYLGQDTKVTSWYQTKRLRDDLQEATVVEDDDESQNKAKQRHDPLNVIQKYLGPQKPSKAKTNQVASETSQSISKKRKHSNISKMGSKKRKRSKRGTESSDCSDSSSSKYRRKKRKHKHKKQKKKKSRKEILTDSSPDSSEEDKKNRLEMLRQERLKREREENARAEKVLAKLRGEMLPEESGEVNTSEEPRRQKQKYNSQYNPDLAKQNKNKVVI